jgi:pyocin large subunit-like protein
VNKSQDFLKNSGSEGIKININLDDGTVRLYEPSTNSFGAYNPDATTKTFFKPTSPTYWERQSLEGVDMDLLVNILTVASRLIK